MLINHNLDPLALKEYSPVTLAYIGDAVFELMVRSHIATSGFDKIKNIHRSTVDMVKAESQARVARNIFHELDEEEQEILRRGRNAKINTPRNTTAVDYCLSTGFEALIGYLYLKGEQERLHYLVQRAFQAR